MVPEAIRARWLYECHRRFGHGDVTPGEAVRRAVAHPVTSQELREFRRRILAREKPPA